MRDQTVRYVNGAGNSIILQGDNKSFIDISQLYDYTWDYKLVDSISGVGGDVTGFQHKTRELSLPIRIRGFSRSSFLKKMNDLHEMAEADVLNLTPGKLYVDNQYTVCYLVAGSISQMARNANFATESITVLFTKPFWRTEKTYQFNKIEDTEEDPESLGKKYNLRYPYRYGSGLAISSLRNTHYAECPAIITIYGPVSNPLIQIASNTYNVDTVITATERLVIDQTTREIYIVGASGTITNKFNNRNKQYDIFKPVPVGESQVLYSGEFMMTISLVEQRSQLKWME